jgi:hypothetical protein
MQQQAGDRGAVMGFVLGAAALCTGSGLEL